MTVEQDVKICCWVNEDRHRLGMPLCEFCLGITLEDGGTLYPHQPSWRALQHSARECPLCRLFKDELHASLAYARRNTGGFADLTEDFVSKRGLLDDDLPQGWDENLETTISVEFLRKDGLPNSYLRVDCGLPNNRLKRTPFGGDPQSYIQFRELQKGRNLQWFLEPDACLAFLDAYTLEDDPMADFGISVEGVVGRDPGSDANFSMLTQWIEECITTHEGCCSGFPLLTSVQGFQRPLPTRLIDVSYSQTSQRVFLSETAGQLGSYVALSHRWGSSGDSSWKTTVATLKDKRRSIDVASLPRTYRDAITITWKLGQRYLWLDSLCIIQDSAEDWSREAAVMGHIYENSLFTVCASGAESSHIGCLARREPGPFDPFILEQQVGAQKPGRVYLYRQVYTYRVSRDATGLFYANVDQSPLATRAWAMQERMLSARNIHYGKEQIFWECLSKRCAEGGRRFVASARRVADHSDPDLPYSAKPSQGYLKSPRWYIYWYRTVEVYTARKLTRSTDKLPALSGLAMETQKQTGDRYLAGLWSTCLHHGLAWQVAADSPSTRPPFYRAPSWSWAAIDGPVTYNASFSSFIAPGDILPAIDVLDVHVVPAGLNKLGEVTAGWIKLAGQLKLACFKRSHPTSIFESCYPDASATDIIGDYADDAKQIWDNETLYCLRLSIFPFTEGPSIPTPHPVLVLQPTFNLAGQYRRVGSGTIWNTHWFDDCPMTEITIV